jgi:hypothetical protein
MVFTRSRPRRRYRHYRSYREQLRRDFRYRCAYCLTHEGHNGWDANYCIDHFRPRKGAFGRPDLEHEYTNLYWACRECNEIKGDIWPDEALMTQGFRFLDPCQQEDDHDAHWRTRPDGSFEPLTPAGTYTISHLRLNRETLQYRRRQIALFEQAIIELEAQLLQRLPPSERSVLERYLQDIRDWLEPPVFTRPRRSG